jgi:small-conductance mechanosensitive channel
VPTVAVTIDGTELFRVRGVSSYTAEARAASVRERILAAAEDRALPVAAIQRVDTGTAHRIVAGDRALITITDADAAVEGVPRADLAAAHLQRIQRVIEEYRRERTPAALSRAVGMTVGATVAFALVILAVAWIFRLADRRLRMRVQERVRSVGIQSFEVVRADQIRKGLESLFYGIRALIFLMLGLVYVGYVLTLWPLTHALSRDITGFALAPIHTLAAGLAANTPRLVFLVVLYFIVRLAIRLVRLFFEAVDGGAVTLAGFEPEWAIPTYKIVRLAVVAFGLVVAYPYIPGSSTDAFKGISLFVGIVFSLGSSSAIANMIAGYMMIYRRAFKPGDRVKIGDSIGEVLQTRLQVTHLRSLKNEEIVIPNSEILSKEVVNFSSLAGTRGLLLHTEVGIGYETPWRQVEAMLLAAAARTPGLGEKPAPFVLLKRLGDFAVVYELNVPCADATRVPALYTALHQHVLDVFNEHGVQIMTPAYEGDPPVPKVVPMDQWYLAPATTPQLPNSTTPK